MAISSFRPEGQNDMRSNSSQFENNLFNNLLRFRFVEVGVHIVQKADFAKPQVARGGHQLCLAHPTNFGKTRKLDAASKPTALTTRSGDKVSFDTFMRIF